jgi:mono/diheme cytochrome c family protein
MREVLCQRTRRCSVWLILAMSTVMRTVAQAPEVRPGLELVLTQPGTPSSRDIMGSPGVCLYVPAGQSPTPFLAGGAFHAKWTGFLSLELRGEYQFAAELNGQLALRINGIQVLETRGSGSLSAWSQPIRLSKGTNWLMADFTSPAQGDSFVRLQWSPKGGKGTPVPGASLSHREDTEWQEAGELHLGRHLFLEHRCSRCHADGANHGPSALDLDAPSLEQIGSERNYEWLVRWIANPRSERPGARMPRLFHTPDGAGDAAAAAAFLASLKDPAATPSATLFNGEQSETGKRLFDQLHCAACHDLPENRTNDPKRIPLEHAAQKFAAGRLAAFLRKPEARYRWIRMPNFHLSESEATDLEAYLRAVCPKPMGTPAPAGPALLELGRKVIQTRGCLNCHALKLVNQFSATPLAALPAKEWQNACLASTPPSGPAPFFGFSSDERKALRRFAGTDRASLGRQAPMEFADRELEILNCRECHGKFDGFPALDLVGEKLKPEWVDAFLSGKIPYKPRPWLDARMPSFPTFAQPLAQGIAMRLGFPPKTAPEPAIDRQAAQVGQKLVSSEGGLSCISCHAVGSVAATQVFENAGINFAYISERLLKPYYERWLRNPLAIDPVSKMPVFFDEDLRSPLVGFYEGDGAKQIQAIWEYLRLAPDLPLPAGLPTK